MCNVPGACCVRSGMGADELIRARRPAAGDGGGGAVTDADFDAFVVTRGAALVRTARGLLRDPHDAEDVVQDVLVKVHQHWHRIVSRDSPDAYVRRMLVNACVSFWRRPMHREHMVAVVPGRRAPDETGAVDERHRLMAALRQLPAKQRAVLVLRHYEGLDDAEIADVMQTSVVTVRSNVHRGLANLRTRLAALDTTSEGSLR